MNKLIFTLLSVSIIFFSCEKEEENSQFNIGDNYQGGVIFYLDGNGGGLIAASSDQSTGLQWGCVGTIILGTEETAIGMGNQNTNYIEAGCITNGTAADICANLNLEGYNDWFLPSKDELNEMYVNKEAIGGFVSDNYWSSSQYNSGNAWGQYFGNGGAGYISKEFSNNVRAIRAF